jgi:uncharacterized protein
MKPSFIYHPITFFLSCFFLSAALWLFAAYISLQESMQYLLFPLVLGGMSCPTISALIMLAQSKNKSMSSDFFQRLSFKKIKLRFIPIVLLLMPCLVMLAITISLLFGFSSDQLLLSIPSDQALQGINFLAIFIAVFLSCSLEEIGWRGYGIDSLNSKFNLWKTSLIFATLWSLWHVPAFFIKNGYFQKELWNLGLIHVVVYFMSLFPITILINWLYAQNNRSIVIAILFHAIMNLSYGLFPIQLFTKIILMLLLFIVAGTIVIINKELFFKNHNDSSH